MKRYDCDCIINVYLLYMSVCSSTNFVQKNGDTFNNFGLAIHSTKVYVQICKLW